MQPNLTQLNENQRITLGLPDPPSLPALSKTQANHWWEHLSGGGWGEAGAGRVQ